MGRFEIAKREIIDLMPNKHRTKSQLYKHIVEEAKKYKKAIGQYQFMIGLCALKACTIKHGGGGHWSDFKDIYHLKRFAEDIGITYCTLAEWVRVTRNVYLKATPQQKKELSYTDCRLICSGTDANTPKTEIRERIDKYKEFESPFKDFKRNLPRLKYINHCLTEKYTDEQLKGIDQSDLIDIYNLCSEICKKLRSKIGG